MHRIAMHLVPHRASRRSITLNCLLSLGLAASCLAGTARAEPGAGQWSHATLWIVKPRSNGYDIRYSRYADLSSCRAAAGRRHDGRGTLTWCRVDDRGSR